MQYRDIREDMVLAEMAMDELKMNQIAENMRLLCEVYCLTPFKWQAFYARIYDGENYTVHYAKPYIADFRGLTSVSAAFACTLKADSRPAYVGRIYCGIKHIAKNNATIQTLLKYLPKKEEIQESPICIDGVDTVIINRTQEAPVTLYFRNEAVFKENQYSDEEMSFLHDLFLHMEKVIGNARGSNL